MNSLGINLKGQVIVVKPNTHTGTIADNVLTRMVRMEEGSGLDPQGSGTRMMGRFVQNPAMGNDLVQIADADIERPATPRELELI